MIDGMLPDEGDDVAELAEINVVPFIDVMLVLLIIFMVAAPLATVDINIDLPASSAPAAQRPDEPVWLTLNPDLSVAIGNDEIPADGLAQALGEATGGDSDTRLFLRADKTVSYGDVMELMNQLRENGYLKIALVGMEVTP